jgi:hypothetical protein
MGYSEYDLPALRNFAASRTTAMDRQHHAKSVDAGQHPAQVLNEQRYQSNRTSVPGEVHTGMITIPADVTTPLGQAAHVLHGIVDQTSQFYAQLQERKKEFTEDGLVNQRREYQATPIPGLVNNVREVVAQRVVQAEQDVAAARKAISPEPTDVLDVAKAEAEWRRKKAILDSRDEGSVVPAAIQMFQDADPKTLAVLADELDDYGQSRNLPEFADALLTQVVPEYAAKKDKHRRAIQCQQVFEHDLGRVERFIQTGELGHPIMPVDVIARYDPDLD